MKLAPTVLSLAMCFPLLVAAQDKPATPPPPPAPARPALHTYRMTFTLTESEAGKRVGVQHISMTSSADGHPAIAKIGSRIPIATGSYSNTDSKSVQTQMTYLDIGLNIAGRLSELGYGLQVGTKIEQSSMADAPPAMASDPIIRQESIECDAIVTPGKSVMLGSLDIPGSTRHTDVELVVERVP
jgi:hypothetical protein